MSSSVSIRSLSVSPEQRAEHARQARVDRLAGRFLPALAEQAAEYVQLATSCGQISATDGQLLHKRIGTLTSIDEVRHLVSTLPATRVSAAMPTEQVTVHLAGPAASPAARSSLPAAATVPANRGDRLGAAATPEMFASSGALPTAGTLRPSTERIPTHTSTLPSGGTLLAPDDHKAEESAASLTGARWELTTERTRLTVLIEEAAHRGLDLSQSLAAANALLSTAQHYADAGALGLLTDQLRAATRRIDEVEAAVDEAAVQTASRQATLDELRRIAEDRLGFTVAIVDRNSRSGMEGTTADGRTLELHLERAGDHDVLLSTVTDIGNALPEGTPGADQVCESSVLTAQELHRAIDDTDVLEAGPVSATKAPTRGHPDAPGTASAPARRSRTAPTKQMRRNR